MRSAGAPGPRAACIGAIADVPWQPGSLFDRAGHAVTTGS